MILCVDDELFLLNSLEETLKRSFGQEYIIEGASTGEEALLLLEEFERENIDVPVIISDQAMPDIKGADLLILIHQKYPKILKIMLTGQANVQDVGKAVNHANLYRYISKPWEENDLILTVKEAIRSYFQEKSLTETNQSLQLLNVLLEQKVGERTAELEIAKQDAELANQVKSNFLCMISHELRTPLSAIIGFSQLLIADKSLNQEQVKNSEIINQNGEHLLILINDILSMSKIEKGKIAIQNHQFNLRHFLDTIKEMMEDKANQKKLQFILEYDPALPQFIIADNTKLRQVLIHLISNGIKFTSVGSVVLEVYFSVEHSTHSTKPYRRSQQNIFLHFKIKDTGIGIPSNLLNTLFNPFVQTRTGKTSEGTGLGLPISSELVQLMGGKISVETEVGKGSTFEVKIPIETSLPLNESDLSQSLNTVIGLEANQPQYRILILDSVTNYSVIIQKLQEIGFEIVIVNEQKKALELWQKWQPHLIFVNTELIQDEIINIISPTVEFHSILIAIIPDNDYSHQADALLAGFNDVLANPFSLEIVLQKISQHLGVRYLYCASETVSSDELEQSAVADFNVEELAVMPLPWVQQFQESTSQCNERSLYPLIDKIPTELEHHATLLKELIGEFRYDLLLDIANQLLAIMS